MGAGAAGAEPESIDADQLALERLLQALSHPLRRRIMALLAEGEGSAKTISRQLGIRLGNVSYHLNKVLAEECELVELVDRIPRRGAEEKVYRLDNAAIAAGLATIRSPSFASSFAASGSPAAPC